MNFGATRREARSRPVDGSHWHRHNNQHFRVVLAGGHIHVADCAIEIQTVTRFKREHLAILETQLNALTRFQSTALAASHSPRQPLHQRARERWQVVHAAHADFQLAFGPRVVEADHADVQGLAVAFRH